MKQIISIAIILIALFNLSCYCIQGELTKNMIEKSDIIFEGRIVKIKSESDTNDNKKHYVTFNISRLIKGNNNKKITLLNQITSCSFLSERYLRKYIGLKFIAYFSKEGNYYSYRTCKNRIIFEKPIKRSRTDSTYYEKLDEYKRKYKEEITKLDSLINSK